MPPPEGGARSPRWCWEAIMWCLPLYAVQWCRGYLQVPVNVGPTVQNRDIIERFL